jgi:hypothetical protein
MPCASEGGVPSASVAKWVVMLGAFGAACGSGSEESRAGHPPSSSSGSTGAGSDARPGAGTGGGAGTATNGAGPGGRASDASVTDAAIDSAIDPGVPDSTPGSDIAAACARLAAANCARLLACSREGAASHYGTEADCIPIETALCERFHELPGLQGGVRELERLTAEAPTRSCALHVDQIFAGTFSQARGTLPTGARCNAGPQCASGTCYRDINAGSCGNCIDAPATLNQECGAFPGFCGGGLICNADYRCVRPPEAGQPCVNARCAPGDICINGLRCERYKFLGEDCEPANDTCSSLTCDPATRKCAVIADNAEGSACIASSDPAGRCAAGLLCVGSPSTCRAFSRFGAACGSCPFITACVDGTCAVPPLADCR